MLTLMFISRCYIVTSKSHNYPNPLYKYECKAINKYRLYLQRGSVTLFIKYIFIYESEGFIYCAVMLGELKAKWGL